MTEPMVTIPVREMFARIERKLDTLQDEVHELQLSSAARDAVGRARAALWTAGIAAVSAVSALIVVLFQH